MCVNSWQLKDRPPILALAPAVATPRRLGLTRFGSSSPLIYVSTATPEIGLWDIQLGRCHPGPPPPASSPTLLAAARRSVCK